MIDVREYVRTDKGIIGKVLGIYPGHRLANYHIQFQKGVTRKRQYLSDKTIIKHSKNIIDLIEVGDYVNGCYVLKKAEKNKKRKQIIIDSTAYEYGEEELKNEDIETIVTKEQYKQIEYIVKE